jgi:hypothetical protein
MQSVVQQGTHFVDYAKHYARRYGCDDGVYRFDPTWVRGTCPLETDRPEQRYVFAGVGGMFVP